MAKIRTTSYSNFGGVDFSVDSSLVAKNRSPWAPNMIADIGGMPEKRVGWRTLYQLEPPINGIFCGRFDGLMQILVHGGDKLYRLPDARAAADAQPELLAEDLHSGKSSAVQLVEKLWILTGGEYLCYDGETLKPAGEDAYIPTTSIARPPKGGGLFFESINLLTPWRKNEFIPDGTRDYQLDDTELDPDQEVSVTVKGEPYTGTVAVTHSTGRVTLNPAPAAPGAGQEGEVVITYAKTVEGYAEKIAKCSVMGVYSKGSPDRLVVAGNPEFPNQDWISGFNDPSYLPDLGYAVVGGSGTAILGYAAVGEYQAIIKESSFQDATVFLRSSLIDNEGEVVFPIKQAMSGVGAVARGCIGFLNDEPIFLAPNGVVAITANTVTGERTVENRSYFLDQRLVNEDNLAEAMAVNWRGYYLIGVNGRCYVLDGRTRTYRSRGVSEFVYEGYHWENIPARCWCNVREEGGEDLYFGTADGRLCRFNTDLAHMDRYSDDGAAICAAWTSPADDDGSPTREKALIKQGSAVTIRPYARSSARIYFRTERDAEARFARYEPMDIFDREDIDFQRFTFNANDGPQEVFFRNKVKRYKRLQLMIVNDAPNEGFGIYGITKYFVVGKFAKR